MSFGEVLKDLRTEKRLTRYQLAKELNLSLSALTKYENDEREPKFEILLKISDYFLVSLDYLLGRTDIKNKYEHSYEKKVKFLTHENLNDTISENFSDIKFEMFNLVSEHIHSLMFFADCGIAITADTVFIENELSKLINRIKSIGMNMYIDDSMIDDLDYDPEVLKILTTDEATNLFDEILYIRGEIDKYLNILCKPDFYEKSFVKNEMYFKDELKKIYSKKSKLKNYNIFNDND